VTGSIEDTPALTTQLKKLADRGIDRVFQRVGKRPPLDLPTLFEIVKKVFPEDWEGTDERRVEAIKTTIRVAAKQLKGPALSGSHVTLKDAALRLYDLTDLEDDLAVQLAVDESRYSLLCRVLEHEMAISKDLREKVAAKVRDRLALALQSLVAEAELVREAETPVNDHADLVDKPMPTEAEVVTVPIASVAAAPSLSATIPPPAGDPALAPTLQRLATDIRRDLEANERQYQVNDDLAITVRWVNAPPELVDGQVSHLDLAGSSDYIHRTFAAIPSRRLVVLGGPGAGKTVLAEQFALSLLRNQPALSIERVPVVFDLATWNPKTPLESWMADALASARRYLRRRKHGLSLAKRLLDERLVFPIFDGLDEMAESLQPLAIGAINDGILSGQPFLLLSRSNYHLWEAAEQPLLKAGVVQLEPLAVEDLIAYLPARTLSATPKWQPVLDRITAEVEGTEPSVLFPALRTPLMVSVVRSVYRQPGADPTELLGLKTGHEVIDHLFDKFVDSAYTPAAVAPGEPEAPARWGKDHAIRSLEVLAVNMHAWDSRDHEWWKLSEDDDVRAYVVAGFSWCLGLTIFELALGLTSSWKHLLAGVVAWTILTASFVGPEVVYNPLRLSRSDRRSAIRQVIRRENYALLGLPFLLFLSWLVTKSTVPDQAWPLVLWPLVLAVAVVQLCYTLAIAASEAVDLDAIGPRTIQQDNRVLAMGASASITTVFLVVINYAGTAAVGHEVPIVGLIGLGICLFVWALLRTHWGRWQARNIWAIARYKVHFQSLAFLMDAHKRGILRRNGSTYRFRHGLLQDRLAARVLTHPDRKKPPSSFELPARYSLAMSWASVGRTAEALAALKSLRSDVTHGGQQRSELAIKIGIEHLHMALQQGEGTDLAEAEAELRSLIDPISETFGANSYWLYRCRLTLTIVLLEAWRFGAVRSEHEALMSVAREYYGENSAALRWTEEHVWRVFERHHQDFEKLHKRVADILSLYNAGISYSINSTGQPVLDGADLSAMADDLQNLSDLAVEMRKVHIGVFTLKSYLVTTLLLLWRFDEAAAEYRVALDQAEALLGQDHPAVLRWERSYAALALSAHATHDAVAQTSLTR
jgi:hypothetical protein